MAILAYENVPNNSANLQYIALAETLMRAKATTCMDGACEVKKMKPGMGNSIALRRWSNPSVDTNANNGGTTKASRALAYVDFTATLNRYTESFQTSTYNATLHPYDAVKGASEVLGSWQIPETREAVRFNTAKAFTSVLYNSPAISTRGTVNGIITGGRIQKAIAQIKSYRGMPFTDVVPGTDKVGTGPLEGCYKAYCHTDLEPDLRNQLSGFKTVSDYPNGKGEPGEFGCWQNVRFFTAATYTPYANAGAASTTLIATNATGTTSGSADVYPIIIVAKGALASVALEGDGKYGFGNAKVNVLSEPDKSDPNNDRIVVAASWGDQCLITSNEWGVVIEVGATRNPA